MLFWDFTQRRNDSFSGITHYLGAFCQSFFNLQFISHLCCHMPCFSVLFQFAVHNFKLRLFPKLGSLSEPKTFVTALISPAVHAASVARNNFSGLQKLYVYIEQS
jgi:hypothetical protein